MILGAAVAGLFGGHAAQAQHHYGQTRYYNHEGRPYYRGPLRVSLAAGTAFYDGDLGNSPADNFYGPAVSAGMLYRLTPHLHVGSELSYFKMGARDKAKERGLAFTSTNGLGTVFLRFDLLADESIFAASQAEEPAFQLFVQGGAGLILYDPRAYLGTSRPSKGTAFLAPERNDYPALAAVFPLGVGFDVHVVDRVRAGVEANYYFTTTDQLDDVNTRLEGNSRNKDGFGTLMLKMNYALR